MVTLLCGRELAGMVLDRFGTDVWMVPVDEEYFRARVLVSVSPQFSAGSPASGKTCG